MRALCVSAIASNQGKTILTMALLHHFKNSVRPFKIGPDFIDPQFHQHICQTPSINLDAFMMNKEQLKWLYQKYSDKDISICEGVAGFYDGMDKKSSAYNITKLLGIPTMLLLDGSASYITVSAVLLGLKKYKKNNTIKAVILNHLSSEGHFELIKKQILADFSDIAVLGWIQKDLDTLSDTHLGLDLTNTTKIKEIAKDVLRFIDMEAVANLADTATQATSKKYPFKKISKIDKKIVVLKDENFSFIYHDNIEFLKEYFTELIFVNPTKDEAIPPDADIVYLPGGYVETNYHYNNIKNSTSFENSLITHAKTKHIYAECAGMLYLSKNVDEKKMSGILDLEFTLHKRFQRMGYYYSSLTKLKGHAFHYTNVTKPFHALDILSKEKNTSGEYGSYSQDKIFATYLHIFFRNNAPFIKKLATSKSYRWV